jgi:hypothetical protein
MNAHAIAYPSLQRRLIIQRRQRALFLVRTTQQVRTSPGLLLTEIARAAVSVIALVAWSVSLLLIAS